MRRWLRALLPLFALALASPARSGDLAGAFPSGAAGYAAAGKLETYDRETVYDYMDGGAEVYLAYGMVALSVRRYEREGEPPITFHLFEMEDPAGAYGAFTFERMDADAGVGQGSEYGGGQLRFWRGRTFGFLQSESETARSRMAVLTLARAASERLGPDGEAPGLPSALEGEGLRPLTVRFVRSPLLLETMEPTALGNPLGLPGWCEAAVGRYGAKGVPERAVLVALPDGTSAERAVKAYLEAKFPKAKPGKPFEEEGGWCLASASGRFAVLVLGAPSKEAARGRLESVARNLGR